MTYPTIHDFVHDRTEAIGYGPREDLKGVTVRLELHRVDQLDLLAEYLGYNSRQQVTAQLLSTAIDDALHVLSEALQDDPEVHARFIDDHLQTLQNASEGV